MVFRREFCRVFPESVRRNALSFLAGHTPREVLDIEHQVLAFNFYRFRAISVGFSDFLSAPFHQLLDGRPLAWWGRSLASPEVRSRGAKLLISVGLHRLPT